MTTAEPPTRLGEIVDDHYRIVEHIADGGMASVYRAEHVNTGVSFAVKILHPDLSTNAEVAARFQREVQAYRRVQHPHVVVACDFGRLPDSCLYMVLEYTPGDDLCVVLFHQGPFAQDRAVKIALQTSLGLVSAHAAGVVHRDLKPENIMLVSRDGDADFAKILDFGIAKVPVRGEKLTVAGSVFGTPEYMAPEQASGGQVDERTDLYTLGTVLYEMLTGSAPFAGRENASQAILAQLTENPPPLPASIDPEVAQLVMQLLAKDPAQRPQRAADVAATLYRILARLRPTHPVLQSATVSRFVQSPSRRPPPTVPDALPLPASPGTPPHGGPGVVMGNATTAHDLPPTDTPPVEVAAIGIAVASPSPMTTASAPPARSAPQPWPATPAAVSPWPPATGTPRVSSAIILGFALLVGVGAAVGGLLLYLLW